MYTLFLPCPPSGLLVSSLCWSIGWAHHRTDRTSKQHPSLLGTRPALSARVCFVVLSFLFLLFCIFSLPFLLRVFLFSFLFFRVCPHIPWICSWYDLVASKRGCYTIAGIYCGAPTSYLFVFLPSKMSRPVSLFC